MSYGDGDCCEQTQPMPLSASCMKPATLVQKLESRKEKLEDDLLEINNALALLKSHPAMSSLLTSIQRVGIY